MCICAPRPLDFEAVPGGVTIAARGGGRGDATVARRDLWGQYFSPHTAEDLAAAGTQGYARAIEVDVTVMSV